MRSSTLPQLRAALERVADPAKAPQMQAYMKSGMPYHGVPLPLVRQTCRLMFAAHRWATAPEWQAEVLAIWRGARFREERYAAIVLTGHRSAREFQTPAAMKLYEEMIVSGAWWDFVDDLAVHRVGPILAAHPTVMRKKMVQWSRARDRWKRRTSIICQIMLKAECDLDLLYACIEPSIGSDEFFLRKAIGWALRQVAWHDPEEVIGYVRRNKSRLSPLSKREALKNVLRSGKIREIP